MTGVRPGTPNRVHPMTTSRRASRWLACAALLLAAACEPPTAGAGERPAAITLTRETAPRVTYLGAEYAGHTRTMRVFVSDEMDLGVDGVTVRWVPLGGGGTFAPAEVRTNELGEAVTTWTAGTAAGPQAFRVEVEGTPLQREFTLNVSPDTVAAELALSRDSLSLVEGTDSTVAVRAAEDRYGNAYSLDALPVAWTSLDTTVARVVVAGRTVTVRGVAPGRTRVIATARGAADTMQVEVTEFVAPGTFASVSSGTNHACGVAVSGGIYCWGDDGVGQLGNGAAGGSAVPVAVSGLPAAMDTVAAGASYTCALDAAGAAWCWGDNSVGQLGDGGAEASSAVPVAVQMPAGVAFEEIAVSLLAVCGRTSAGAAWCWGSNFFGELGIGDFGVSTSPVPVAVAMPAGTSFRSIASGQEAFYFCAVTAGDAAWCWGDNSLGQLGLGDGADPFVAAPARVAGGVAFRTVAAGASTACALTPAGAPYCWGTNAAGEGAGAVGSTSTTPVALGTAERFASLSLGLAHACGVRADGVAFCWGDDSSRQLGNGPAGGPGPVRVLGAVGFLALDAGTAFVCATGTDHEAYCWGDNGSGQLGVGTTVSADAPLRVQAPTPATARHPAMSISRRPVTQERSIRRACAALPAGRRAAAAVCRR